MKQTIFQLHDIRCGFRKKNRSNIDQLVKLKTFIRDAFVYKLRTYAVSAAKVLFKERFISLRDIKFAVNACNYSLMQFPYIFL